MTDMKTTTDTKTMTDLEFLTWLRDSMIVIRREAKQRGVSISVFVTGKGVGSASVSTEEQGYQHWIHKDGGEETVYVNMKEEEYIPDLSLEQVRISSRPQVPREGRREK